VISRRSLLLPAIVAAAALAILIALGVWQFERKAWKESLIATLAERIATPPSPIPPRRDWPGLGPTDEVRRVTGRVAFTPGREARVYSGGAGLRQDVKRPGYFAFAPARLADGTTVVVNRGHVDHPNPDATLKPLALPATGVDIVGALRWPEPPGWFVSTYSERQAPDPAAGGHVDDRAAARALHRRDHRLHPEHRADQVHVDHPPEPVDVLVLQGPEVEDPRVVDEHGDGPEAGLGVDQ
jgi:cytochrome oxidase assembly protein ShyY1